MTGQDDGATATGGMSGITEDAPGQAGAPGEAGSIDGVSAAGAAPGTYDVTGYAADSHGTEESARGTGRNGDQAGDGLISGDTGGVTGTSDP